MAVNEQNQCDNRNNSNNNKRKREHENNNEHPLTDSSLASNKVSPLQCSRNNNSSNSTAKDKNNVLYTADIVLQTTKTKDQNAPDVCQSLNLKDGDRLEVLWDLTVDEEDEDDLPAEGGGKDSVVIHQSATVKKEKTRTKTTTRWWGATLLLPSGNESPVRTHTFREDDNDDQVTVPIRVLNYDPYPDGGYDERSLCDVVFLSEFLLYDLEQKTTCVFRREGSEWEPTDEEVNRALGEKEDLDREDGGRGSGGVHMNDCGDGGGGAGDSGSNITGNDSDIPFDGTRENLLVIVESILGSVLLSKFQSKMSSLTPAQQRIVAEKVATAKEAFADKMMEECERNGTRVITAESVRSCMEEVGKAMMQQRYSLHATY